MKLGALLLSLNDVAPVQDAEPWGFMVSDTDADPFKFS